MKIYGKGSIFSPEKIRRRKENVKQLNKSEKELIKAKVNYQYIVSDTSLKWQ
jgi:hypothetical protein